MAARLQLDIITNASKAVSGLKQVESGVTNVGTSTTKASAKISGVGKAIATGFVAAKVLSFTKATVAAAGEQAVAQKRLAAVFKATGDQTGHAAQAAADYAGKLSAQTGIQKPLIENSQAILASFKAVSSESARQAGIFNQTTQAAADLAAAGFGDMASNSKALGKALSDPVKGMTALRRVGVTLSAAQQQNIANLEKSGNLLGAQKALLAAVQGQVGGTAAATATSGAKMSAAFTEIQAKLGTVLLPYIKMFKAVLLDLFGFVGANAGWLTPIIATLGVFAVLIYGVSKAMAAWTAIQRVWTLATQAATAAQAVLNAVMAANPIFLVIAAVVLLVAIFVVLYLKCAWLRAAVAAAWAGIQVAIQAVVSAAITAFNGFMVGMQAVGNVAVAFWHILVNAFQAVISWLRGNWPLLVAILAGPFGVAVLLIVRNWSTITGFFSALPGRIGGMLSAVVGYITAPFSSAWNAVQSITSGAIGFFTSIPGRIAGALGGVFDAIISPFQSAWDWVQNNIFGPIKGVWNSIAGALNAIHISLKVPGWVPGLGGKGWEWSGPNLPMLASGGIVNRPTLALIGERGPEAVIPLGRGAPGGTTVLNVTVNVPPTANPAQIGAQVVRVLKSYVRANGPISGLTA